VIFSSAAPDFYFFKISQGNTLTSPVVRLLATTAICIACISI
jgi:hypothetical protein